MESNKGILILLLIVFISCTIVTINQGGWDYIKTGDIISAHKEFLRDYAYHPDSIQNVSGLAYTFFLLNQPDSSLKYVKLSLSLNNDTNYTVFVSLTYYHFYNNAEACSIYNIFLNKYDYKSIGFFIDSIVEYAEINKMGLLSFYASELYEEVYDILKNITDINKNLDINEQTTKTLLLDYINNL